MTSYNCIGPYCEFLVESSNSLATRDGKCRNPQMPQTCQPFIAFRERFQVLVSAAASFRLKASATKKANSHSSTSISVPRSYGKPRSTPDKTEASWNTNHLRTSVLTFPSVRAKEHSEQILKRESSSPSVKLYSKFNGQLMLPTKKHSMEKKIEPASNNTTNLFQVKNLFAIVIWAHNKTISVFGGTVLWTSRTKKGSTRSFSGYLLQFEGCTEY